MNTKTFSSLSEAEKIDLLQQLQERVDELEHADTEEAPYDSQTRLKAVFEQTQQFMCLLHTNGHILEVNHAALKYAGLQQQDAIGKPLWEMAWWQLDDNAAMLKAAFQQSLKGEVVQYETRMCGQNEMIADIDLMLKPIVNHKNQTTMILVEGHNITQRKLAEEQMRLALEKEQELSALKSRFITFTSHEFRTPLAIIASSAYLLKRQGFDISEEMRDRHFNKIQNNVDHIAEMLDDILLLGHLRAKQLGVYAQEYPISHMAELLLKDFEKRYGNTHSFTLKSNPPDIRINADQTLLEQALNQLVKNAVNYSAVRGQVDVCLTLADDTFTMLVRDNGIGILPEDISKIFESFVRGSNVDNFSGTGLGLAIVKDVVELHHGTITVESQPGNTTFTVTIPQHQPN